MDPARWPELIELAQRVDRVQVTLPRAFVVQIADVGSQDGLVAVEQRDRRMLMTAERDQLNSFTMPAQRTGSEHTSPKRQR